MWDGDGAMKTDAQVQVAPFNWEAINPLTQRQAPRVHKLQIFGDKITAEQAAYAKANPVGDVGELTDLSKFNGNGGNVSGTPAPDDDAEITLLYVNQDGSGDYTTIQAAINAVPDGNRGIIYIAPESMTRTFIAGPSRSMINSFRLSERMQNRQFSHRRLTEDRQTKVTNTPIVRHSTCLLHVSMLKI